MSKTERIALLCASECVRQGVGLDRVSKLIQGLVFAQDVSSYARVPREVDIVAIAGMVEPDNKGRYRQVPVTFASGGRAASADAVYEAMGRLFEHLDTETDAREFTKAFLDIHPFTDGNGRTAFILYNWIAGTLHDPEPLPEFYES